MGHCLLALAIVVCAAVFAPDAAMGGGAGGRSGAGRIIYLFRDALWSANPDGTGARSLTKGMPVYAYDVAPDGGRVAFAVGAWRGDRKRRELVESEVWVVNADGAGLRKLAAPSKVRGAMKRVGRLRWSRDGQYLAFEVPGGPAGRAGRGALFAIHLAEGAVHAVALGPVQIVEWTPDGEIKYRQIVPGEEGQAEWVVSPAGAPHPRPVSSPAPAASASPAGEPPVETPPSPSPAPPDAAGRAPAAGSAGGAE